MSEPILSIDPAWQQDDPVWRRLGDGLWAGRRGSTSLGTIEALRRFVWIDAEGDTRGRYRSLQDAQHAAEVGTRPRLRTEAPLVPGSRPST